MLAGTRNLRDIGGYRTRDGRRTRWRTRSSAPTVWTSSPTWPRQSFSAPACAPSSTCATTSRSSGVRTSRGVRQGELPAAAHWSSPPPGNALPALEHGYRRELDQRGAAFAAIYRALLAPAALPAVIHGAAGKDRTGVVAALLLAVGGVETGVIAEDDALSATCLGQEYIEEGRQWLASRGAFLGALRSPVRHAARADGDDAGPPGAAVGRSRTLPGAARAYRQGGTRAPRPVDRADRLTTSRACTGRTHRRRTPR